MTAYSHHIIAHGKALAEALSMQIPFSDCLTHRAYNFLEY